MNEITYLYDDSWDGLLSAIFEAYQRKENPSRVISTLNAQTKFTEEVFEIESDFTKAKRVELGIIKHMGSMALDSISTAYLSCDNDKSSLIYRYVRAGIKMGRSVYSHLTDDNILAINNLNKHTQGEAHLLIGFVRFSLLDNGVYFSRITPKNSVLPLIMPHFADRFSDQPFLIFDPTHNLVGIYDLKGWRLIETAAVELPNLDDAEIPVRQLWKQFYNTIAIAERTNHKCRRNHMPKRYWGNMTEFLPHNAL